MIRALTFDMFGTVLDWRGSIAGEIRRLAKSDASDKFCGRVAETWAKGYSVAVTSLRTWINLDVLLASAFGRLAPRFGLADLCAGNYHELATAWSRLDPWPDAVEGFDRLKGRYKLAALTNANRSMLIDLAAHSGLPLHVLLPASHVEHYKPHPDVYRMAVRGLGLPAEQILMVAAHCFDLNAAKKLGFLTALVTRPRETGSDPAGLDHAADFVVRDISELAERLLA